MTKLQQVAQLLRDLLASQRLAVLATAENGQPYSNLVAFAETDELRNLLFVTSRSTRKYANLKADGRVAMLVDSRTNQLSDFENAVAVTATGIAEEVLGSERNRLTHTYITKHPHLAQFMNAPDSALIRVRVGDYVVARFGEVTSVQVKD